MDGPCCRRWQDTSPPQVKMSAAMRDHGPTGWALSAPLEDAADAQLGLQAEPDSGVVKGSRGAVSYQDTSSGGWGCAAVRPRLAIPADLSPGVEGGRYGAFLPSVSVSSCWSVSMVRSPGGQRRIGRSGSRRPTGTRGGHRCGWCPKAGPDRGSRRSSHPGGSRA